MSKLSSKTFNTNMKEVIVTNSMFKVFDEKPSDSRIKKKDAGEIRICAHDLFSMFTADIIKKHGRRLFALYDFKQPIQ